MLKLATQLLEKLDQKARTVKLGACSKINAKPQELSDAIKARLRSITNHKRSAGAHPGENKSFEDFVPLHDQIDVCKLEASLEKTAELSNSDIELIQRVMDKMRKYRHYCQNCLKQKQPSMTYGAVLNAIVAINTKTLGISLRNVLLFGHDISDLAASSLQLQHSEEDMQPSLVPLHQEQA